MFSWYLCLLIACICKQPSLSMENRGVCSQVSHDTAGKGYALWTSPKAFWSLWSGPLGDLRQLHQLVVKYRMNSVDLIWTEKCFSFQVFINWKSALALSKTCIPVISEFKWVICVSQDTPSFFLFSPRRLCLTPGTISGSMNSSERNWRNRLVITRNPAGSYEI